MKQGTGKGTYGPFESARVLMVENGADDEARARHSLEEFGCSVDVAEDAAEAIGLFQLRRYDIVFVGHRQGDSASLELIRRFREFEERLGGNPLIPLIALIAAPTDVERKACFAAGVDGWIGKPLMDTYVGSVLDRWLVQAGRSSTLRVSRDAAPAPTVASVEARRTAPVIDRRAIDTLRRLATPENPNVLDVVVDLYLESTKKFLDDLADACARNDLSTLPRLVSSLRSSSANVGAVSITEMCRELENIVRLGDAGKVRLFIAHLAEALDTVGEALAKEVRQTRTA